jgi:Rrf2 family protein
MRVSQTALYAIRALLRLRAQSAPKRASASTISRAEGMPPNFTRKILTSLAQHGLVESLSNHPQGGFELARPAERISLWDIFQASHGESGREHDIDEWFEVLGDEPAKIAADLSDDLSRFARKRLASITLADLGG